MCADRRVSGRMLFTGGYLPPAARIRPGRPVVIVDLSCAGALVEGPWRFRPQSRCDVHVQLAGQDVQLVRGLQGVSWRESTGRSPFAIELPWRSIRLWNCRSAGMRSMGIGFRSIFRSRPSEG